jgi:hypothetical protein
LQIPNLNLEYLSEIDLAYIAGLIDGEGCMKIHTHKQQKNGKVYYGYTYRISISNTDKNVLCWVHKTIGMGNLLNQPNRQKNHKYSYRLEIAGKTQILMFLPYVIIYLKIKRDDAYKLFRACHIRQKYGVGVNPLANL